MVETLRNIVAAAVFWVLEHGPGGERLRQLEPSDLAPSKSGPSPREAPQREAANAPWRGTDRPGASLTGLPASRSKGGSLRLASGWDDGAGAAEAGGGPDAALGDASAITPAPLLSDAELSMLLGDEANFGPSGRVPEEDPRRSDG